MQDKKSVNSKWAKMIPMNISSLHVFQAIELNCYI